MVSRFLPSICLMPGSTDQCGEAHSWKGLEIWTFDLLILQTLQSFNLYVYHDWDLQRGFRWGEAEGDVEGD